jgi:lipopolysaccharide/colanic/teichoic acid biosynthesis glycosyltransferase
MPAILRRCRGPINAALLIATDVAVVIAAVGLVDAIAGRWAIPRAVPFGTVLLFVTFAYGLGLYATPGPSWVARLRVRTIASFGAVALEFLISARFNVPTAVVLAIGEAMLLVLLGHYAEMAVRSVLMRAGLWGVAAVIVNDDEKGRKIADLLRFRPEIGLSPIGFAASMRNGHDAGAPVADTVLPYLGPSADLSELDAIFVFTSRDEMALAVGRRGLGARYPRLLLVEDTSDLGAIGMRVRMLDAAIGIDIGCDARNAKSDTIKRAIDLCVTVPLAVIAVPVIAVLAGLIVLVSGATPFYRQERVGHRGQPIRILKLRTMYVDAAHRLEAHLAQNAAARGEWERFFKLRNDPRVLPVIGNFIRCSSLDELPQFWNVLRGDLSLVGPRPFPAYHIAAFDPEFQTLRASIKPGLTGLWQVSARSNGDIGVQKTQDSFYIRNWSLWLDFYILLETLPAVLRRDGAR